MFRTLFTAAGQLGQGHDGNIQFLCHDFQVSGNLRNFLHTVINPFGAVHQLQIVDNHQIHIFQPANLGFHLRDGNTGIVVQINGRFGKNITALNQPGPFAVIELTGAQLGAGHQRFGGKQTGSQLFSRHFQREKGNPLLCGDRRMTGNVQGKAGFTHTGTSCQNNQIGAVQAGNGVIQLPDTGGNALI